MHIFSYIFSLLRVMFFMGLLVATVGISAGAYIYWNNWSELPSTDKLKDIRFQEPLRVYTKDNALIGEYGNERRIPIAASKIPKLMIDAILAAEDAQFFNHGGVSAKSLIRAAVNLIKTGKKEQGGSTITMQVARNFFLTREQTYSRKFNEILLALKIESTLSKDEILELYLNKIFFGHRAYGIGAAAQIYYGRSINELTLAEFAMLAEIPKAPSTNNPITNPKRAMERRNYVLKRMFELGYISKILYKTAINAPNTAKLQTIDVKRSDAPYVAELVRAHMVERFGEGVYTSGYHVFTTIDSKLQSKAQTAVRNALFDYDERYGYRGPLKHITLPEKLMAPLSIRSLNHPHLQAYCANLQEKVKLTVTTKILKQLLATYPSYNDLVPSLVLEVKDKTVLAYNQQTDYFEITWSHMRWAARKNVKSPSGILKVGDIIMARKIIEKVVHSDKKETTEEALKEEIEQTKINEEDIVLQTMLEMEKKLAQPTDEVKLHWRLSAIPQIEGALVSLTPESGAILTLVGGFDFYYSKFNRVTQAERQPGSNFKPFVYSAALDNGFTPASIINDAPLTFKVGNTVWKPENFGRIFYGPTRLRIALTKSQNLASIRLLQEITVPKAIDHVIKFGFKQEKIPKNLTFVLGTGNITPLELVAGFAVFANGGYKVQPYLIEKIKDSDNKIVLVANPKIACITCQTIVKVPEQPTDLKKDKKAKLTEIAIKESTVENNKPEVIVPPQVYTTKLDFDNLIEPSQKEEIPEIVVTEEITTENETISQDNNENKPQEIQKTNENYAPRAISSQNAWLMTSMLKDVIRSGTAKRALKLDRSDIAGKTGTTNGPNDAWFSGYTPDVVTTTWVGFDQPRSLGSKETGGRAALPMWMEFMQIALENYPEKTLLQPSGLVTIKIDPRTGLQVRGRSSNAIDETFIEGTIPTRYASSNYSKPNTNSSKPKPRDPIKGTADSKGIVPEQLF